MCSTPRPFKIYRGEGVWEEVLGPCRECSQCYWRPVNDYTGRGLCEADQADHSFAVTLTYRDREHDLWHMIINPTHFQNFIRALRKRGYFVRYIASGEYGETKGRAHFHAVLFFYGEAPDWAMSERIWDDCWPHGHIWAEDGAQDAHIRYVLKYIQKDKNWFSLSKKPTLGWPWFENRALLIYEAGLMPVSRKYRPINGTKGFDYSMQRTTWRDYLLLLHDLYEQGDKRMPALSELVEKSLDAALRWRLSLSEERPSRGELFTDMLRGIRDGSPF